MQKGACSSHRDEFGQWDPKNQRPGLEPLQRQESALASTSTRSRSTGGREMDVCEYTSCCLTSPSPASTSATSVKCSTTMA